MNNYTTTFVANNSGDSINFKCSDSSVSFSVDNISLKEVSSDASENNYSIKEFLTGTTDEGEAIFFRADTQTIQLNSSFETFSSPIVIATKTQRGTLMKCFVSLDGEDFYEISGTIKKGVSVLKVHSRDKKSIPTPPLARDIKISWRDSSKQLCRLIQTAIVFIPGNMDYTE